jgi:hypothetical protein
MWTSHVAALSAPHRVTVEVPEPGRRRRVAQRRPVALRRPVAERGPVAQRRRVARAVACRAASAGPADPEPERQAGRNREPPEKRDRDEAQCREAAPAGRLAERVADAAELPLEPVEVVGEAVEVVGAGRDRRAHAVEIGGEPVGARRKILEATGHAGERRCPDERELDAQRGRQLMERGRELRHERARRARSGRRRGQALARIARGGGRVAERAARVLDRRDELLARVNAAGAPDRTAEQQEERDDQPEPQEAVGGQREAEPAAKARRGPQVDDSPLGRSGGSGHRSAVLSDPRHRASQEGPRHDEQREGDPEERPDMPDLVRPAAQHEVLGKPDPVRDR